MYLHEEVIAEALTNLSNLHPFFGITFLVCKQAELPVGRMTSFPINKAEETFLGQFYHPDLSSKYFYQPFRTSSRAGKWLAPKYASSGSQSTRTRGHFAKAFLHERNTDQWGWARQYVAVLKEKLEQDGGERIPAFWLAAWLFRNRKWSQSSGAQAIVQVFLREFLFSREETNQLFEVSVPNLPRSIITHEIFDDRMLLKRIEPAPDASPEEGGTLRVLQLRNVGPARQLDFNPAERLSIITGDNGLGKTFLLECAWWSLTGQWAERPALPNLHNSSTTATIAFAIAGKEQEAPRKRTIPYSWDTQGWPEPKDRPTIPGLIVYARVDGSFAIWDPIRHRVGNDRSVLSLVFTRDQVLNGLDGKIEGLIRDWVRWQHSRDASTFNMFCRVLERLSPPDMVPLKPGQSVRLPHDSRDVPTLVHNYAVVPFSNESAGVRRIVTIAYLLVWAWSEHRVSSSLAKKAPQEKMVILVDEVEAHLHPKWQRVVLPALLDVTSLLSKQVKAQMIVATHSPLILASMESNFSDDIDKLFHLYLSHEEVQLDEVPFLKHGSVDAWLTSEVFEMKQARSQEGEDALEQAKRVLAESSSDLGRIRSVHASLAQALPPEDPFWPRW